MLKKLLLTVFGLLVVAVLAVLGLASTQPDAFAVARSIRIAAPPDKVWPLLADFRQWSAWSPWEERDPAMKRTYSTPSGGVGASYAWSGNAEVGAGRMEILAAEPAKALDVRLDFTEPFEGHNRAEFRLAPEGDGTAVTWRMTGPAPLVTKVMMVFVDMDRMIGRDFEAGLAKLKTAAER